LELECSRAAPIARLLYTGVADPTPNQLKQRVKNLSEYSRDNDPRVLGDLVQNFPPEGQYEACTVAGKRGSNSITLIYVFSYSSMNTTASAV